MNEKHVAKLSDLIALDDVCRLLPRRTHRSTVFRWAQKGSRGVKLRVVAVGGTKCTTEKWLMEYFEAVKESEPVPGRGPTASSTVDFRYRAPERAQSLRTQETLRRHGLV